MAEAGLYRSLWTEVGDPTGSSWTRSSTGELLSASQKASSAADAS